VAQGRVRNVTVHGHRGARARRPENTLAAFEYAIAAGVDAIELDVVLTADGAPMVAHDPVAPLTLAEVRRQSPHIPTLPEVLALAPLGRFLFNIELKPLPDSAGLVGLVAPLVASLPGRVLFQSFDFAILHELRRRAPEIPRGALFEDTTESFAALAESAQVRFVAPEYHLVTDEQVRSAHATGVPVITWTPNRQEEWQALIEAGVDGLITDDPAALIEYLKGA
jgi:glycerophosphoryl diester phosphodiesterase